jgi:hypothetical protein
MHENEASCALSSQANQAGEPTGIAASALPVASTGVT